MKAYTPLMALLPAVAWASEGKESKEQEQQCIDRIVLDIQVAPTNDLFARGMLYGSNDKQSRLLDAFMTPALRYFQEDMGIPVEVSYVGSPMQEEHRMFAKDSKKRRRMRVTYYSEDEFKSDLYNYRKSNVGKVYERTGRKYEKAHHRGNPFLDFLSRTINYRELAKKYGYGLADPVRIAEIYLERNDNFGRYAATEDIFIESQNRTLENLFDILPPEERAIEITPQLQQEMLATISGVILVHELGHSFGLDHGDDYVENGNKNIMKEGADILEFTPDAPWSFSVSDQQRIQAQICE